MTRMAWALAVNRLGDKIMLLPYEYKALLEDGKHRAEVAAILEELDSELVKVSPPGTAPEGLFRWCARRDSNPQPTDP